MQIFLRNSSRDGDYVCRYGGEEFSIILPQTDQEQSYQIAERIREKVENHLFLEFSSSQKLTVTVSIGLAMFPDKNVSTKEALVSAADKAMYTAKNNGKNQTCQA